MIIKGLARIFLPLILICLSAFTGCERDRGTLIRPAEFPTDGTVFLDQFGSGVEFQAFLGSKLDALDLDVTEAHNGTASLSVIVPDSGDPTGSYAGGAFVTNIGRNLTEFNALTFWVKASRTATLNVAGIGNDNTGTSRYVAEINDVPLTTTWTKVVIPIPLPEKLTAERGLFYFAEGPEGGSGYEIWFDDIQFETLSILSEPSADIGTSAITLEAGESDTLGSYPVTFNIGGAQQIVTASAAYFTLTSSNTGIVATPGEGVITALSAGSAEITADLGSIDAAGLITVTVTGAEPVPTVAAPTPTIPAIDVISLYSDAYSDVAVDTWSADWDVADVSDEIIAGDNVKKYTNVDFAGIQFTNPTVDASGMTRFHMDIWTPNATTAPVEFKVKLVDYGADGVFGNDDVEHELVFTANTSPGLASQTWVSIDVPLAAFSGLTSTSHLAQLIISGDLSTVYVDNIYFYDAGTQTEPTSPAPTPTQDPAEVISLLSDAYTDVTVDTWSTVWDQADVSDFLLGSDIMKKYSNLVFAAIEMRAAPIDASGMTHFHMNVWTPDATASPSVFKVKLIDFGPNGVYDGGGDDVEHELVFDHTTMSSYNWVTIDVPLTDFTGLTTTEHIGQIIISGDISPLFVDNIYFYNSGAPVAPPVPAPAPTVDAANVVSLFSDAYIDVPVETWSAVWDSADVSDFVVDADNMKRYTKLLFAGIEFKAPTVDASEMTHFHMDLWTPDPTAAPAVLKIKLVDFGANGVYDGGGDDVEHEITLDESTLNTGSWVSIELPLTDFVDLTTRGHLGQMIISGDPNTIYVDNIYFHK